MGNLIFRGIPFLDKTCKRRLLDMAFDLEAGSMATIGNLLEGISVWGTLDYKASTNDARRTHDVDL